MEKLYSETSLYTIGGFSKIHGELELTIFQEAINIFIKKNEGIRLRFKENSGEVRQYVSSYNKIKVDFFDFSTCYSPEKEFEVWSSEQIKKPFQLIGSDLYYIAIFKINAQCTGLLVKFHHIISDGWSINIASEQIYGIYQKLINGKQVDESVEYSYIEYIINEQKYLNSDKFLKNKAYWSQKFKTIPEPICASSSVDISGERITYELENNISQKIKQFALENRWSINTVFVALLLIYFNRTKQQEDMVIGIPVLNRSGKKEKNIFGMFTSTMPFRFCVNEKIDAQQLFGSIHKELLNAYFNQKYPYDLLVQDIELRKKGHDSLFQVCVNYYNTKLYNMVDGLLIENFEMYNGKQLYELELIIKDWSDKGNLTLEFGYKPNDYSKDDINKILSCLLYMCEQIVADASRTTSTIDVLPETEKNRKLYEFNHTQTYYPELKTIYELFQEQVKKTPDNIAICFENEQLTYNSLNQKSNQLARVLRSKGLTRNSVVGLIVTHSIEAVIGILAIIKAGGAYLPIETEYPKERIEYMLQDSGCNILLTNCVSIKDINFCGEIVSLNNMSFYSGDNSNLVPVNKPQDLVYVIYTSGSTGKPKGVMIEHKGLVNYIWWAKKVYVKNENDTFALYSALSFDLTVTSIFTPLIGGNCIYVYRDSEHEYVLYRIMREKKVSIIKLTPAHLSLLRDLDNGNSSVKRFIVGGEDLKVSLAADIHRSFGGDIEIYNEYGPTETVVGCMIHQFDIENDTEVSVPIGVPADNVQIYILDKELKPMPSGSIGQMYISGDGVAKGYLNRQELTMERFIDNPYIKDRKMYVTGDLAKFNSDERIVYVGRIDHQVKIHGYRIELGEVEKNILCFPSVSNAVVIDRESENGERYLCAYIVVSEDIQIDELKDYLIQNLPQYMVPLHFVVIDKIPFTVNGKIDRNQLPIPIDMKNLNVELIAARNNNEEKLTTVIKEVLNISEIGMKDNFYYLGGDSIKAIQIASKLNEVGLKVRVRDILSHPVIEDMALCLETTTIISDNTPCIGAFKPTPVMSWFLSRDLKDINYFNQSVLLHIKQNITPNEVGLVLDELVRQHDSLRLNYDSVSGEMFYNHSYLEIKNPVEYYDLSAFSYDKQMLEMRKLCEKVKGSLNIENKIPIKACMFNLGQQGTRILFTAHHVVVDGISWRILLEDFSKLYEKIRNHNTIDLPPKTHSMKEWSRRLENHAGLQMLEESGFWKQVLNHGFKIPIEINDEEDNIKSTLTLMDTLSINETKILLNETNYAFKTKPDELIITALVLAVSNMTGSSEIAIELEGHGREDLFEDIDISRTVGWFTSIYPATFRIDGYDLSENIKSIKEQLRSIPKNGIGYGILKYYTDSLPYIDQKYVRFNFMGDFDNLSQNGLYDISEEDSGSDHSARNNMTCLLDINAMVIKQKLKVVLTYDSKKINPQTTHKFFQGFFNFLREIINFCSTRETTEYTPADFELVKFSQDDLDDLINQF